MPIGIGVLEQLEEKEELKNLDSLGYIELPIQWIREFLVKINLTTDLA